MGLDVYLYNCEDFDAADKAEDESDALKNALYSDDSLTDEQRSEKADAIDQQLGIKNYHHESCRKVEIDSPTRPDHLFKIGYFRSSYNESGIDRILPDGLGGIFDVHGDPRWVRPDWRQSRGRAVLAMQDLQNRQGDPDGRLRATFEASAPLRADAVSASDGEAVGRAVKAMQAYRERLAANPKDRFGASYMSAEGLFSLDKPMDVVAVLVGTKWGAAGHYVVWRAPEDWLDWYIQAIEIVIETIDHVLANTKHRGTEREGCEFAMRWSG